MSHLLNKNSRLHTKYRPIVVPMYQDSNFGITSILGIRPQNEDFHTSFESHGFRVYAIFDGHNGDLVSMFCKNKLQKLFVMNNVCERTAEQILREVVQQLDQQISRLGTSKKCGSTAVVVVHNISRNIVTIANVGDSRCIVGYQDGTIGQTVDHKPQVQNEFIRILQKGGTVDLVRNIWRLNGLLSLSRAIDHTDLKQYGLSSEPDIYTFPLNSAVYVLLACDGLFDVLQSETVDDLVKQGLKAGYENKTEFQKIMNGKNEINTKLIEKDGKYVPVCVFENVEVKNSKAKKISQALTKYAYLHGSEDNITVGVLLL